MPEKFLFHGRFNIICQFERANYLSFFASTFKNMAFAT